VQKIFFRYWSQPLLIASTIFYLSSIPGDEIHIPVFPFSDKLCHALAYGALSFFLTRALTRKERLHPGIKNYRSVFVWAVVFGIFYGISDEFHQSFVPGRSVDAGDLFADGIGSLMGSLIVVPYRKFSLEIEKRLGRKT